MSNKVMEPETDVDGIDVGLCIHLCMAKLLAK